MGVAERKERHKEELKKDILKAAMELFMEKGFEATSIRNIAEKIEYSPATVYLYYKDKNEIIHALHQQGFQMLIGYFTVLSNVSHPFERMKALGRAYIQFALQNPDIYKLLFVMDEPMEHVDTCADDSWDEGDRAFDVLHKTVIECQQIGYFSNCDAMGLSFVIWSTMHGLCALRISGHLGHVKEAKNLQPDIDALLSHTYETFVLMLENLKS